MASASTESENSESEKDETQRFVTLVRICNRHGIKESAYWSLPNCYKETYFLMPELPIRYGLIDTDTIASGLVNVQDFSLFWSELADCHKERRLLADYMAATRGVCETIKPSEYDGLFQLFGMILIDSLNRVTWKLRRRFIEEQKSPNFQDFVTRVFSAIFSERSVRNLMDALAVRNEVTITISTRNLRSSHDDIESQMNELVENVSANMAKSAVMPLIKSFFCWVALDASKLRRYSKENSALSNESSEMDQLSKDRFMKKMKVAVPHWCKVDRSFIQQEIEANGRAGTYVARLLKTVGLEKFKRLAFGKEKFCANCGRSSYIGEDRLWCCKLCFDEHVRPKARYCNVQCQKAHWLVHKAEAHLRNKGEQVVL